MRQMGAWQVTDLGHGEGQWALFPFSPRVPGPYGAYWTRLSVRWIALQLLGAVHSAESRAESDQLII
jgi:hypothetical protein